MKKEFPSKFKMSWAKGGAKKGMMLIASSERRPAVKGFHSRGKKDRLEGGGLVQAQEIR